ncbi:unnamed protein product [Mytilus coruscus]|uniref:Methyltransferase FkbM domain-containing protein n=1 Tax=Mytilus coruscus TaxID=42192 RepID=A0A6J8B459_MYTCO|nr:unnamed protein product [Mytilus coruscus]
MFIHQVRNKYDFLEEMDTLNKQKVDMDDPRLIRLIRNYWIENPSDQPYNLKQPHVMDTSIGQAAFVDNRLHFKKGGFFVECGALDGETRSNTLIFERSRDWNGLLIEADPSNYALVKKKNRKAFTINACLSIYPYPVKLQFKKSFNVGKIVQDQNAKGRNIVNVQCFPFYSIMKALNVTHVDFFSLDVEGNELEVLRTIPFDKIHIDMMTVEIAHVPGGETPVKTFVENKGVKIYLIYVFLQDFEDLLGYFTCITPNGYSTADHAVSIETVSLKIKIIDFEFKPFSHCHEGIDETCTKLTDILSEKSSKLKKLLNN